MSRLSQKLKSDSVSTRKISVLKYDKTYTCLNSFSFLFFFKRGECTETLRNRIRELEAEGKKLTMDMKVKEDQIRELELKVQVREEQLTSSHFSSPFSVLDLCSVLP